MRAVFLYNVDQLFSACSIQQLSQVKVTTSDIKLAGTDSNVYITLFGESSNSGSRLLKESPAGADSNKDKFERGKTDRFLLSSFDLGIITKIKVEKDNAVSTYIVHIRVIAALISFLMNCSWCFILYRAYIRIGILLRFR